MTITKLVETGRAYSVSGLALNMALKAGSSTTFSIFFLPQVLGSDPGVLQVTTSADPTPLAVTVNGTGVAAPGATPSITVTPTSVNFGNVTVGSSNTQTLRLSNSGTADLTISKISASGSGFSQFGLSIPLTLTPGQDTTFTASFKPTASGNQTGSISITSNAAGSPMSISLSGSGVTTNPSLASNPMSLNFGTVSVGTNSSLSVQLTNTGNVSVAISSVATTGAGFSASGAANATLAPNQTLNVTVNFDPTATGNVSGTLTVSSNAPTLQIALTGQGAGQMVQHTVSLSWDPSTSAVAGYNVYRGSTSGGPYNRVNQTVDSALAYSDQTVLSGLTYYYVVTAIDGSGIESAFSNQASITVPTP